MQYADALAGNVRRKSDIPGRERGTIAWGVASYLRSAEFPGSAADHEDRIYLAPGQRSGVPHGHRSIKRHDARRYRARHFLHPISTAGPAARHPQDAAGADTALDCDRRDSRPTRRWASAGRAETRFRAWTETEIETFERRWPIGSKERLAFATDAAHGPAAKRRAPDDMGGSARWRRFGGYRSKKTTTRLLIPVHARSCGSSRMRHHASTSRS